MIVSIKRIAISNFRSIRTVDFDVNYLAVLVGKNDCGKSNILRALNLFFNGETNPGEKLDFDNDHNYYNNPNRKAKEIIVKLELNLPESYRETNGNVLVWEKRWRSIGKVKDDYYGYRIEKNRLGNEIRKQIQIPAKSNLHTLLSRIEYRYVPAIKDVRYFDSLRGEIYRTIAAVAQESFRASSTSFEESIGTHMAELTSDIAGSLGIETRMAFPRDLSHIFEKLDFLGGDESVSLDSRGDGIKARHIPLILKFIVDKRRSIAARGTMPYSFIWGYEEPENNLELTSCVNLADEFWQYMYDEISQIFLTTHSPVFYNLDQKNAENETYVTCMHVYIDSGESGTDVVHNADDLDERMGTMSLFAPRIQALENNIRRQEEARLEAERIIQDNKCKLFVEGESDKIILSKIIDIEFGEYKDKIDIKTKENGAGHHYVLDMLSAWQNRRKHHRDMPKAAGIVDDDAKQYAKQWNSVGMHVESCKCFVLKPSKHIIPALREGFKVPATLETMYPDSVWRDELNRNKLVRRNMTNIYPDSIANKILSGERKAEDFLSEEWRIYVEYDFDGARKIPVARKVANMDDAEYRTSFADLSQQLRDVIDYLFV